MNRNITATILIVLAVGIYFTITEGVLNEAKKVSAMNRQYTDAIENATTLIKARDKVRDDWKKISVEDQEKLNKMIPESVDNIRLVIDLNNLASKHGFSLKGIKANVDTKAPTTASAARIPEVNPNSNVLPSSIVDTVTVSFSVTAPYLQFISFMQDLESNLRLMDISHLTVSANDSGIYDFSVELKTYWLRQ